MHILSQQSRGLYPSRLTLADQDGSIHSNRRLVIWDETGVDGGDGGNEGRTCKTVGSCHQHLMEPQIHWGEGDLIPVVTAT